MTHSHCPSPITLTPESRATYGLRDEVIRKVYAGVLLQAIIEAVEICNRESGLQERIERQEGSSQAFEVQ
jgi:hypothetical protein